MLSTKLLALALGAMLTGCGTNNVAADYIKNGGGQTAADATPDTQKDPGTSDGTSTDGTGTETTDGTGGETGTDPVAGGDVAKGNKLLEACVACHNAGGLAKGVTLNADAVSRLDAAFTGPNAGFHSVYAEAFQAPGRADVEAALKATK